MPFREVGPDRLLIQEGGGPLAILGLPFLAAGIFMILGALGVVPVAKGSASSLATPLLGLMGLLFTAVGGALAFGRAWTTIDATRREVAKEWGLLRPMYRTVHSIDARTTASIGFEPGNSDSREKYPLTLRSGDSTAFKVCSLSDYATARACGVAVARHLRIDLEDATTDHARRVPASQADATLKQRARLEHERGESSEPPVAARSTVTYESDGVRIAISNPRLHPVVVGLMLLPAAMPLVMAGPLSRFFRQTATPGPIGWIFLAFLVVGFGVLPASSALLAWLRSRLGRTVVTASSEGILLEKRGIWGVAKRISIAANDIIDLDYSTRESAVESARVAAEQRVRESDRSAVGSAAIGARTERMIAMLSRFAKGRGVTVKSRHGLIAFGEGLDDAEIRYLYGVIRRALIR